MAVGDGLSSALDGVLGLTEAGGIAGVELRWLAIGAVEQGNGCRYASAWCALLGDVGNTSSHRSPMFCGADLPR